MELLITYFDDFFGMLVTLGRTWCSTSAAKVVEARLGPLEEPFDYFYFNYDATVKSKSSP